MGEKYKGGIMKNQKAQKKYKGVRRRKWGKWVSEVRVPGSARRLWLGSYVTPEAAAVARDVAFYCLKENSSSRDNNLNFPHFLAAVASNIIVRRGGGGGGGGGEGIMSPTSVQNAASDAGMAIDAQLISNTLTPHNNITLQMNHHHQENGEDCGKQDHQIWQPMDDDTTTAVSTQTLSWDGFEFKDQALTISIYDYL